MSDFLLVLGGDHEFCFIPKSVIREIHPIWAVETRGKLWGCSRGFKDKDSGKRATICGFRVIAVCNQEYSCSVERIKALLDDEEWNILLGEKPEIEKRRLGFYVPERTLKETAGSPSGAPTRTGRKDPDDPNERAYLEAIARDRREDLENTLREVDKECSNSSSTPTI